LKILSIHFCTYAPSGYQQVCDTIADEGIEYIVNYINANYNSQQICTMLGLCNSKKVKLTASHAIKLVSNPKIKIPTIPISKLELGDTDCDACTLAISTIETWIENTNNQQTVITTVEVVCSYMPSWESTCDNIVTVGVPTVIQWITQNENATVVCGQLEMCPTTSSKPQDIECDTCSTIFSYIENYIASGSVQTDIENYLDMACALIPEWADACEALVENDIPALIKAIESKETPVELCSDLGLCSSKH